MKDFKRLFLNSYGVSLVESMIALGVLIALGYGTYELRELIFKKTSLVKRDNIIDSVFNDIRYRLRNKAICESSLNGASAGANLVINGFGSTSINLSQGVILNNQLQRISDPNDTTGILEITELRLLNLDADSQQAEIKVQFEKKDFSNPNEQTNFSTKLSTRTFPIRVDIETTASPRIAGCLDPADVTIRSIANTICNKVCPDNDPSCSNYNVNPTDKDSLYNKCRMAFAETVKAMEKELCEDLGIWDPVALRCKTLYAIDHRCPNGQTATGIQKNGSNDYEMTCVSIPRIPSGYRTN